MAMKSVAGTGVPGVTSLATPRNVRNVAMAMDVTPHCPGTVPRPSPTRRRYSPVPLRLRVPLSGTLPRRCRPERCSNARRRGRRPARRPRPAPVPAPALRNSGPARLCTAIACRLLQCRFDFDGQDHLGYAPLVSVLPRALVMRAQRVRADHQPAERGVRPDLLLYDALQFPRAGVGGVCVVAGPEHGNGHVQLVFLLEPAGSAVSDHLPGRARAVSAVAHGHDVVGLPFAGRVPPYEHLESGRVRDGAGQLAQQVRFRLRHGGYRRAHRIACTLALPSSIAASRGNMWT